MDSYQAIYDAVRSRISNANVGDAVERAVSQAFDISHVTRILNQEFVAAAYEMQRPSVLFKPEIKADGDEWCVLLGEDLQRGVCGFGKTPAEAFAAFDLEFYKGQTPAAIIRSKSIEEQSTGSERSDEGQAPRDTLNTNLPHESKSPDHG